MIITSQGFGHFTQGKNNQDFGWETPWMLLILDGCSGSKYSEVGTRLFAQLFSRKKEADNVETFEDTVQSVFEDMIGMVEPYYPIREDLENAFIMENLLFTILACFETETEYIVKLFGDGYIITQNQQGCISYMKFSYGNCPPYFAYKYCNMPEFATYAFKTFRFRKEVFPKIAIATDGVMPLARGEIKEEIDQYIMDANEGIARMRIHSNKQLFSDDVTIATFGGNAEWEF